MKIEIEANGAVTLASVTGTLDASSCELLEATLSGLEQAGDVSLDLADLAFVDSSGLSQLLKVKQRIETSGRRVEITAVSSNVRRLLEITGLLGTFGLARRENT